MLDSSRSPLTAPQPAALNPLHAWTLALLIGLLVGALALLTYAFKNG